MLCVYFAKTIIGSGRPAIDGQLQAHNCHAQPTANEQHTTGGTRLTVHNWHGSTHAQHPTLKHTAHSHNARHCTLHDFIYIIGAQWHTKCK